MYSLIGVISFMASIWTLINIVYPIKKLGIQTRKLAAVFFLVAFTTTIIAIELDVSSNEAAAREAGYESHAEMREAERARRAAEKERELLEAEIARHEYQRNFVRGAAQARCRRVIEENLDYIWKKVVFYEGETLNFDGETEKTFIVNVTAYINDKSGGPMSESKAWCKGEYAGRGGIFNLTSFYVEGFSRGAQSL